MNYKKGLFRAWWVFGLCWVAFFTWQAYDSYRSYEAWQGLTSRWHEAANQMMIAAEEAPIFHEGGLDRDYYLQKYKEYQKYLEESAGSREAAKQTYDDAILYGPLLPIVLFVSFFVFRFIALGFLAQKPR